VQDMGRLVSGVTASAFTCQSVRIGLVLQQVMENPISCLGLDGCDTAAVRVTCIVEHMLSEQ
jgi:hypothetical protein